MKLSLVLIVLVFVMWPVPSSHFEAPFNFYGQNFGPASFDPLSANALKIPSRHSDRIPASDDQHEEWLRLLTDYKDIIRPGAYPEEKNDDPLSKHRSPLEISHVDQGNFGLISYTSAIFQNDSKLKKMAFQFYNKIWEIDSEKFPTEFASKVKRLREPSKNGDVGLTKDLTLTKMKLTDNAGEGKYTDLRPGWLWTLALNEAGGDSATAIRLIGLCGHDDFIDNSTKLTLSSQDQTDINRKFAESSDKNRALFQDNSTKLISDVRRKWLSEYFQSKLRCPSEPSVLYLNKSLGSEFDISDSFKEQIINTNGAILAKRGLIKNNTDAKDLLPSKNYHLYAALFVSCELMSRRHKIDNIRYTEQKFAQIYRAEALQTKLRNLEMNFETMRPDLYKEWDDAKTLFYKWNKIGQVGVPVTSISIGSSKPKNWDQSRFEKAKARVESWKLDSDWTQRQHEIGVEFANKYCKPNSVSHSVPSVSSLPSDHQGGRVH